jgi:hypothetical protein
MSEAAERTHHHLRLKLVLRGHAHVFGHGHGLHHHALRCSAGKVKGRDEHDHAHAWSTACPPPHAALRPIVLVVRHSHKRCALHASGGLGGRGAELQASSAPSCRASCLSSANRSSLIQLPPFRGPPFKRPPISEFAAAVREWRFEGRRVKGAGGGRDGATHHVHHRRGRRRGGRRHCLPCAPTVILYPVSCKSSPALFRCSCSLPSCVLPEKHSCRPPLYTARKGLTGHFCTALAPPH